MFILGIIIGVIVTTIFFVNRNNEDDCPHDFHFESSYTNNRTNLPEYQIMKCSECGKLKKESI